MKYTRTIFHPFIVLLLTLVAAQPGQAQPAIYVDASASGANDGSSWTDAYTHLQDALDEANTGTSSNGYKIHLAEGVYYPDEDNLEQVPDGFGGDGTENGDHADDDPEQAFTFERDSIKLVGGYPAGGGTRAPDAHVTVLTGDITQDDATNADGVTETAGDQTSDNSLNVVYLGDRLSPNLNITAATVIKGVTITAGGGAGAHGGGLHCNGNGSVCSPTIANVDFLGNAASSANFGGGRGGAIYLTSGGNETESIGGEASPTITNATFSGNIAANGGAMYIRSHDEGSTANPGITNATFTNNTTRGDFGNGGAVYITSDEIAVDAVVENRPVFEEVTFANNSTGSRGGAVYNSALGSTSNVVFSRATFRGNSAEEGGAVFNVAENASSVSTPTFVNTTFINNTVTDGNGGAVYNTNESSGAVSSPTFTNVLFSGNAAHEGDGTFGGGGSGGAVYNHSTSGTSSPSFTNVIFYDNVAADAGAIFNRNEQNGEIRSRIVNATFVGNIAQNDFANGGAIYNNESRPTITNSIFLGNRAGGENSSIANNTENGPTISYSLINGSSQDADGDGDSWNDNLGTDGGNNLDADPMLADTSQGNLHLMAGSPALNAGDDSALPNDSLDLDADGNQGEAIPYDVAENTRVQESAVDLGAYEGVGAFTRTVDSDNASVDLASQIGLTLTFSSISGSAELSASRAAPVGNAAVGLPDSLGLAIQKVWSLEFESPPSSFSADVCFQLQGPTYKEELNPRQLAVHKRNGSGDAWRALSTELRPNTTNPEEICATGVSSFSDFAVTASSVALPVDEPGRTTQFTLKGNYPNPFAGETTIRYALPKAAPVTLTVYDVLGQEVATLVDRRQAAGRKQVRFETEGLPAGVYVYRLQAGDYAETRQMVVVE